MAVSPDGGWVYVTNTAAASVSQYDVGAGGSALAEEPGHRGRRHHPVDVAVSPLPRRPTSKDQCKNGGWHTFPVFKNQGDCVSFVATGGKNPPRVP